MNFPTLDLKNNMTIWYRKFKKHCERLSSHLRFVVSPLGFARIYWTGGGEPAYIHEVDTNMPYIGHDIYEKDIRLVSKRYYEEYEDTDTTVRNIKNYKEGFWDSMETIKKRVYMLKNDKEFRKEATGAYRRVVVK